MRHVIFILCTCMCLLVLGGCKVRRTAEKSSEINRTIERIEQTSDKEVRTEEAGTDIRIEAKEDAWEYSRTTDIDSAGNIRRVQETWRGYERSELALQRDSGQIVSGIDSRRTIVEANRENVKADEAEELKNDSRLIQGIEWLWVAMGIILLIVILIFRNKTKIV